MRWRRKPPWPRAWRTAIVVLLLFVISTLFPIGTAIALLVGLLDGIFTAICKIANWAGGEDASGQNFEAAQRRLL